MMKAAQKHSAWHSKEKAYVQCGPPHADDDDDEERTIDDFPL